VIKKISIAAKSFLHLIVRYKYISAVVFFGIWMLFFDRQNMFYKNKLKAEKENLINDTLYYSNEIKQTTEKLEELKGDKKALEKYARETYLMKSKDEDVFVIVNEASDKKSE
jgi:hypothetical protein